MQTEDGLLIDILDRRESHVRPVTASRMEASAASFLPRLPLIRHGATNLGAISLTVWPKRLNSLAQQGPPEQASMPIRQGGRLENISSNWPRTTLGLYSGL